MDLIPGLKGEAPYIAGDKTTDQYNKPAGFDSDDLINNEIGVKSEWFDHRLQANLSLYKMDWSNVQLALFDPVHLGNTTFVVNGPTYEVKGVELQLVARVMEGLTVQGSGSWNSTNQTNAPCLSSAGVTATTPKQPDSRRSVHHTGQRYSVHESVRRTQHVAAVLAAHGVQPARALRFCAQRIQAVRVGGCQSCRQPAQRAGQFPGSAIRPICATPIPTTTLCQYTMPGYTTYDAAIGVSKDNWTAQFSGSNLTNQDSSTNTNSYQFIKSETPLRPRVLTLGFGYKF